MNGKNIVLNEEIYQYILLDLDYLFQEANETF